MRLLLLLLPLLFSFYSQAQQYKHMRVLSHWDNDNLPKVDGDQTWSDLTGWHDSTKNREYIIAGGVDSLYFFDITDPYQIKLVDVEEGRSRFAINRDIATYSHYAYCVSDQASGSGGLQVFDLKYLPDSVHLVYSSDSPGLFTHTIFIEDKSKRLYMCRNKQRGFGGINAMDVISLINPEQPVKLASLLRNGLPFPYYVHEMFARNDTAYVSCGDYGLFMIDLRNLNDQKQIGSITQYPEQGYNHSSWLDASGKKLMFTDENQGLDIKIFDISDPGNPLLESTFNSNTSALPHNAYWKDNMAIASVYEDGVVIFDITDVENPKKAAWYDTYPLNDSGVYNGFHGCWGVWPYLPSGNIIASDISEGIFVLRYDTSVTAPEIAANLKDISVFPNPCRDHIYLNRTPENGTLTLTDVNGKVVTQLSLLQDHHKLNVSDLMGGIYFLRINSESGSRVFKISKLDE